MIKASKDFASWDPTDIFGGGKKPMSSKPMNSLDIQLPSFLDNVPSSSSTKRGEEGVCITAPTRRARPLYGGEIRSGKAKADIVVDKNSDSSSNPRNSSRNDMDFAKMMYGKGRSGKNNFDNNANAIDNKRDSIADYAMNRPHKHEETTNGHIIELKKEVSITMPQKSLTSRDSEYQYDRVTDMSESIHIPSSSMRGRATVNERTSIEIEDGGEAFTQEDCANDRDAGGSTLSVAVPLSAKSFQRQHPDVKTKSLPPSPSRKVLTPTRQVTTTFTTYNVKDPSTPKVSPPSASKPNSSTSKGNILIETLGLDEEPSAPSHQKHSGHHRSQTPPKCSQYVQTNNPSISTPVKSLRSPTPMSPIRSPFGGSKSKIDLDFQFHDAEAYGNKDCRQSDLDIPLVVNLPIKEMKEYRELNGNARKTSVNQIRKSKEGRLSKFLVSSPQASRVSPRASTNHDHDEAFPLSARNHGQQQQNLDVSNCSMGHDSGHHLPRRKDTKIKIDLLNSEKKVFRNERIIHENIETSWKNLNSNTIREWNYWKEDNSSKDAAQQIQRMFRGHQGRREASRRILKNERERLRSRQKKYRQNVTKGLNTKNIIVTGNESEDYVDSSKNILKSPPNPEEIFGELVFNTNTTGSIEAYTLHLLKTDRYTDQEIRELVAARVAGVTDGETGNSLKETSSSVSEGLKSCKVDMRSKLSSPAAPEKVGIFQVSKRAPYIEVTYQDNHPPLPQRSVRGNERDKLSGPVRYENELVMNYDEKCVPNSLRSPQGNLRRPYNQTPSKLTSDPNAPTHPITIGQNNRKQMRVEKDSSDAKSRESAPYSLYPNAQTARPPSQPERSQRPRFRKAQQKATDEASKDPMPIPLPPHLLSNHRERHATLSANRGKLEKVDESSRELDGTETLVTARSTDSGQTGQTSQASNLRGRQSDISARATRKEANISFTTNSETLRRQKQEEDKILEELEALNNRKDNLLVNIKGKYDDEVRSEVPLKLGVDRANNYDSKKKYAAPLKIQQDFREHQKKGNESKGEEKKLSRREEVELARAEREKLGLAFGPGAANQKKRQDQKSKNIKKVTENRLPSKKIVHAWSDNDHLNNGWDNENEIISVASSRAPSVDSRAPSIGIASIISDARSQISNVSKPSLIGQAPPRLVGEKARLLALAGRSEHRETNQPSAGYLNKFRAKQGNIGVRKVFRNIDGAMNDDCISELTSLGGATSLPPLVPKRTHSDEQPATYREEAPSSLRAKERTFSAPARSQQFDDGFVTLPDDD